uniref:Uncharacterized protein n=1 Tax=Amazona collaria TaxID=241587 RepID=A0A8B9FXC5_9PSIT
MPSHRMSCPVYKLEGQQWSVLYLSYWTVLSLWELHSSHLLPIPLGVGRRKKGGERVSGCMVELPSGLKPQQFLLGVVCAPVVPATQEAEPAGSLEPRSSGLQCTVPSGCLC